MKDLYIVAHAQSQHHVDKVVGGWFDTGLTPLGERQARAVAGRLQALVGETGATIVSSDLKRAVETAAIVAEALGATVSLDTDLREMNYGSAGGRPQAWMRENESYAPRVGDRMGHRSIPDGESRREVAVRAYRAMERLIGMDASPLVVVTHGGMLTFLVAAWVGMPIESADYIALNSDAGGITHLQEDDRRFNRWVQILNETAHLRGAE